MRITYSQASKRKDYRYNLMYERGKFFSNLQKNVNFFESKAQSMQEKRKELATKIQKLIAFFNYKFNEYDVLLELMEKDVFSTWEKQKFAKEIPQAMIQMENCMKKNGFEKEWVEWEKFVRENFKR